MAASVIAASGTGTQFLSSNKEDGDYNQYWYSGHTIDRMVEDMVQHGGNIAFLSAPSLYFALPDDLRANAYVFDLCKRWEGDRGYVCYDFNSPTDLAVPPELLHSFDMVVVDPPFITHDVWEKYATTTKLLMKEAKAPVTDADQSQQQESSIPPCKLILTTVLENADKLNSMLGVKPTAFQPVCPTLVYQYNVFTNYDSDVFAIPNPEVPQ